MIAAVPAWSIRDRFRISLLPSHVLRFTKSSDGSSHKEFTAKVAQYLHDVSFWTNNDGGPWKTSDPFQSSQGSKAPRAAGFFCAGEH